MGPSNKQRPGSNWICRTGGGEADKRIIAGIPLIMNLLQPSHFTNVETKILKSGKFIITDLLLVKPRPKQRYQFHSIYISQGNFLSPGFQERLGKKRVNLKENKEQRERRVGEGRETNNCLYGLKEEAATGEFLPKKPNPKAETCFI